MARKPIAPARLKEIHRVDGMVEQRPSEQEMHDRRVFVRSLHSLGMRTSEIIERAILPQTSRDEAGNLVTQPPRFQCKPEAIARLVSEIRADLARELETFQPTARAAGLERLYQHLLRANSELQTMRAQSKKDWASIRGHMQEIRQLELQIAKMEGTLEPVKVDFKGELNVHLQRALTSMTPEQVDEAVKEEEARQRLVESSIITTAEDAQTPIAPQSGRRQALPTPRPPGVLAGTGQAPGAVVGVQGGGIRGPGTPANPRRERSSDIAARREIRSPMDANVEEGARPRGLGPRVIS